MILLARGVMVDLLNILSLSEKNVFALPTDMPIEDGAFIEPITVGLHAFHLAKGCENKKRYYYWCRNHWPAGYSVRCRAGSKECDGYRH